MLKKQEFYDDYGVEEYYIYDPDRNDLHGLLRTGEGLRAIEEIEDWVSPRLGVRFVLTASTLELYRPDGRRFLSFLELEERAEEAEQRAEEAEQRAEETEQRAERLAAQLRALGIDPEG